MINLAYPKAEPKKKSSRKKRGIILAVLVLVFLFGGASGWYFFIFQKQADNFTGQGVEVKIEAPEEVISGSSYQYTIEYVNNEEAALENASLVLYFSPGFNFLDSLPEPDSKEESEEANVAFKVQGDSSSRTWDLGRLDQGERGIIKFKGIILGDLGSTSALSAHLSYQPENFSSNFSAEGGTSVLIKKSLVDFDLELPEKTGRGREVEIAVLYRNITSEDLENVRIILSYPKGFSFISSEPRADREDRVWDFRVLRRGERGRIDLKGKIDSEKSLAGFSAELGVVDQYKQFFSQVKQEKKMIVLNPLLEITATVNGEEETKINPGDELRFIFTYANLGDVRIEDGIINFSMETGLLDSSSISVLEGHYDANEFTWDTGSSLGLASVEPGEKGRVEFRAQLLPVFPYSSLDKRNLELSGKARFESNSVDGLRGFDFKTESNELRAKINTELDLVSEARYFDLDYEQAGFGPLPPKVGQKTTYRIYWTLSNTTNDAENVQIKTILPEGVAFGEDFFSSFGNELEYDPETRAVIWDLGRVQAYAGSVLAGARAWFEVGIIPTADQVGQTPPLTEEIFVSGQDLFTEAEIHNEHPSLNTELTNDLGALGKGEVVK